MNPPNIIGEVFYTNHRIFSDKILKVLVQAGHIDTSLTLAKTLINTVDFESTLRGLSTLQDLLKLQDPEVNDYLVKVITKETTKNFVTNRLEKDCRALYDILKAGNSKENSFVIKSFAEQLLKNSDGFLGSLLPNTTPG